MKKFNQSENQGYNPYYPQQDDNVQPAYPQVPTAYNPNANSSQAPVAYPAAYPQAQPHNPNAQQPGFQPSGYPQSTPQDVYQKHNAGKKGKKGKKDKKNKDNKLIESYDADSDEGPLDCFSKMEGDNDRQSFVQKVFGIMGVQVFFTALFTYWVISDEGRMDFCQQNMWLYFVCVGFTVVIMCALMCVQKAARKVPLNYVLLAIFTICESYVVATIASMYEPQSVFLAALYSVGLFTLLTVYACSTKGDIGCMGPLILVSAGLGLLTFVLYFLFPSHTMHLIFCWVGLIITCIYVIYDVYLITEKHGLSYDDYVIGALLIYTDLISLFIYILSIIGERK